MAEYSYNKKYLIKDEEPWFPVMGEIHYTRLKETLWEEELRKMKAGGVNIASTYVIWIHHEEAEGCFDFHGCRNLRGFLEACQKVDIKVWLRLGPWVHGEVRNGGFPDWLQSKEKEGIKLRSNDETYLQYVRKYWQQVYEQAKDFLYEKDGPVIGIQIENEYGHVGGLQGEEGEAHMRRLTALAKEIGFHAPMWTATGWGGACIGDLLPVMGGYCEAPWDQRLTELEPNANYVFSHVRNDALIACDHHVENAVTFDESQFPYLTAELGGGIQVTSHRRPVATGKDIGAMSVAKLGSGVALLGYYMYHGGSNPDGKLSTLQESRATGYANDLPEINYDFNAPLRQYGTISDNYREIKLLAYFLQDFGKDLAALEAEIVPDHIRPDDFESLRLSYRHDEEHGYLFYNNYQRRRKMADHDKVTLTGICQQGNVIFPETDIKDGDFGFFPYGMKLDDAILQSALATPLCRLQTAFGNVYVFYGDREPAFAWKGKQQARVLHLSRKDALHAFKVKTNQEYLILAEDFVWEENGKVCVTGPAYTQVKCFPKAPEGMLQGFKECGQEGEFTVYKRSRSAVEPKIMMVETARTAKEATYELSISYGRPKEQITAGDILLKITYGAESMDVYLGDRKINDYFYTGQEALLSLGYFDYPEKIVITLHGLDKDAPIFLEKKPRFTDGVACFMEGIEVIESYK